MLDWSLEIPPKVTAQYLDIAAKGLFYPKGEKEVEPQVNVPDLMYRDVDSPSKFQVFVSTYSVDSGFSSWLALNQIHIWTKHDDIPKDWPI